MSEHAHKYRPVLFIASTVYVVTLLYFALSPFHPIRGIQYPNLKTEIRDGAVHLKKGAALEVESGKIIRDALKQSGMFSVVVLMEPESLNLRYGRAILSFARQPTLLSFSLEQDQRTLAFRLSTSGAAYPRFYTTLHAQNVIKEGLQWIVATYDGQHMRLYNDGVLYPESCPVEGDLGNWSADDVLILGDEIAGGSPWEGKILYMAFYERALSSGDVKRMYEGGAVSGAIWENDFSTDETHRMRYRNKFIVYDPNVFSVRDSALNIIAFIPIVWVVYGLLGRHHLWLTCGFGLLLSLFFEMSQFYIIRRVPCMLDLIYNCSGTVIGCFLLLMKEKGLQLSRLTFRS